MIKISVIIPVYNTAQYVAECLESVLKQDKTILTEIICVNDGSTDNSFEVLSRYAAEYANVQIINKENAGLSAARNAGLTKVQGEYVLFLDSDDVLLPNALNVLSNAVKLYDKPDIIAFGSELWNDTKDEHTPNQPFNHKENMVYDSGIDYLTSFVNERGWGPSAACFYAYKIELLQTHNLQFPVGLLHEDELFVPQAICLAKEMVAIKDILYSYRVREASIVHSQSVKHSEDKLKVSYLLEKFFNEHGLLTQATRRLLYNLSLNALLGLRKSGVSISCPEWRRLLGLATFKDKIKLIKKII